MYLSDRVSKVRVIVNIEFEGMQKSDRSLFKSLYQNLPEATEKTHEIISQHKQYPDRPLHILD
jgi:hypothetical protein